MKFKYTGVKNKKTFKGRIEASDKQAAQPALAQQGIQSKHIEAVVARSGVSIVFGNVSLQQKMLFAKHLALLIKSGMPVNEAIQILAEDSKGALKGILKKVLKSVEGGNHLTASLGMYPRVFDAFFISMVQVGEESGTLEQSMENLASHLRKNNELRNKIKSALVYPAIVLMAIVGLGFTLSIFVLPRLIGLFASLKTELPVSTKFLIWFSNFFAGNWKQVLIAFVIVVIVGTVVRKTSPVRLVTHWLLLRLPITRSFSQTVNIASMARAMSLLLASGITLDKAMEIVMANMSNIYYRRSIMVVLQRVKAGESVGDTLSKQKYFFPHIVAKMVRVAEESGNLSETYEYLADYYEAILDDKSKNLSSTIEPILLIVIGAIVAFVASSIITPIYNFTASV